MRRKGKFKSWLKRLQVKYVLWKIARACRKGKHIPAEPTVSLEAAHMREPGGREYSIKIRVEVVKCVYCDLVMDLRPKGIVDARPPVKGDDGRA